MPGHSSLRVDYVDLSAVPGIHVFACIHKKDLDGRE